jgi:Fic family protein
MDAIGQLALRIEELRTLIREAPPTARLRETFALLRREEIEGSTRLAGANLDHTEVRALLDRGRALGGHRLDDYLIVRGYADGAAWAAQRARRPEPLALDDLRTLHRLTMHGLSDDGGAWRTKNLPALADGAVPAPHWLVPFETETLLGRLALEEHEPAPLALAQAITRILRLRPFPAANGRVARHVANLLAYRRGLPPLVLDARARRAYVDALLAADARDIAPLVSVVGRAIVRGLERLRDVAETPEALQPLASFAGAAGALYKAAQRGRLRVVRRNGRLYTTRAWIDAYRTG